ncbi:CD81 antigen-like [Drosophila hydei]|uniref:Tetraspanin n=1 Tax=Drosophila hydei TaxID=7224 RepID=A0A6J1LMH4_DROHY|nr:CD81 antigen-like [Drosophila hydei]
MRLSTELVKFLLMSFNVLSLICGLILSVMGTIMVTHIKDVSNIKEMMSMNTVSIATLAMGVSVVLLSVLGCWGTLRGKVVQLRIYSVIILILFLCQLTFVIYLWTKYHAILMDVIKFVQKVFEQRKTDFNILHTFERFFKCCGENGDNDYIVNDETVPGSCCGHAAAKPCPKPFPIGCKNAVKIIWTSSAVVIKYGALILSGLLLVISLMGTHLANRIRSTED